MQRYKKFRVLSLKFKVFFDFYNLFTIFAENFSLKM